MSEIINSQLALALENGFKVKIVLLEDFVHYGFVRAIDETFVLINLESGDRQVSIKLTNIKEVVVWG